MSGETENREQRTEIGGNKEMFRGKGEGGEGGGGGGG